ncbi:MAG: energy-coupling factor ABC transporter substrate-binding protein [Halobacteriota archaeon]|uniref:energy-coupling factor ABC transporter substrate-binding protein n=1 Tax=Halodesulfurarchaeum sp. HSR-GB TaxID=3074077 RepID=UPI002854610E|nr:energy-coupling factor ABC transporter substrate-binding protein [Halodesulfurarchaeum sp. HSR-GB]MDR5656378.1 energy-coupling factor ABC transporter substrate-binding protein [Halodesulfurarchaeum sp. HSR-GB]
MNRLSLLAGLAVIGLLLIPVLAPGIGAWGGADGAGMALVADQEPAYEPWFESIWTPPSGEIESVLFSLQAAIGGGIIGYLLRGCPDN